MSDNIATGDSSNQNGRPSLFFTPPPEERHVCADVSIAEEICTTRVPNLREAPPPALAESRLTSTICVAEAAQQTLAVELLRQLKLSKKSPRKQSRKHSFATVPDPETHLNPGPGGRELMYPRGLRSVDPRMRASGGSITTSIASNKGQSGLLRSHLPGGNIGKSRAAASSLEESQRPSGTLRVSKPTQPHGLLGRFTGYSSSDEEDEVRRFEAGRKTAAHRQTLASNKSRKNKKTRQPKPAELVVSDTDSVSESEACSVTAPLLLQKEYVGSQSSTHRPRSSVQTKKAEQGRVPRIQRKVLGDSPFATIKSKAPIAASVNKGKLTIVKNKAMYARGKEGAKKPARSVMVKKQPVRHGPFIIDSDTESDGGSDSECEDSTGVEAEDRGFGKDEGDDDNWDAIPPIKPPERMSLDKRNAVWTAPRALAQQSSLMRPKEASAPSSQRAPAFDKAKLKAMLLANKKNQPKFHASPGESSKGQSTSIATKIPAKTDRDSLKSKSDAQPVHRNHAALPSLACSKLQPAPQAAPRTSLSGHTSGFELQSSASTKPASRSARPAEASLNNASTSDRESGSTQNLSKQHIASKHNVGASGAKQLPKCSTQGAETVRKQNSVQGAGTVGLVGSLIQGIRQSEKPLDGTLKNTVVSAVESRPQSQHDSQTRKCSQTVKKNSEGTSGICSSNDGVTKAKTNATIQSSGSSTNGRIGAVTGQNKFIQGHNPGTKLSGRTEVTQAHSIGEANSNTQTPPNIVPTLKRKAAAVGSSSYSETPLHKKPNRTVEGPSFTPSPIVEPRASMIMGGADVLSSTKRTSGTVARKPLATVQLPANTESNLQGPAPKNPVYKTLQKPPKAISSGHETQTVIPKTDLVPTKPKTSESIQNQTAVEAKAQVSQLKIVAAPKASVSAAVPSKSNTVLATPEAKNEADTKSKQHPNRVSEKPFDNNMEDVRPGPSATEMQRKVRKLPGDLDKPGLPTERGSTVASVLQPLANGSKVIAKVAEKDQQHQTVASAQSSTSLPTDQPLPHITANKATSTVTPQSQPNEPVIARGVGTNSTKSAPDANQSICKGKEKRGDVPESVAPPARPGSPAEVSIHPPTVAQKVPVKGKLANKDTARKAAEVSHGPNVADLQPFSLPGTASSIFNLSSLPPPASDAEPYFEYSIFNRIWSAGGDESSINATELTSTPCTNINEANIHVETLFSNAREQYQEHFSVQFSKWTNRPDVHGCNVFIGTFAPIEYPSKKSCMKFWVERHTVSAEAGRSPKELKQTSFVAKTVYVLRLLRLLPATTDSDGETEDTTGTTASTRVYHQLPRTECYTTLDAANRAAKNLQIEMSHKPNPTKLDEVFQTTNLAELNQKANDLRQAKDEESRYWNGKFHGSGLGSEFELFVEKAGLCGPRNL
ncbi:hypothetical protein HBI25_156290 [Parastagonospora nodorum]|nr:hypothetical protein HBH42_175480 [Parastagonospora nodorum]KAH4981969.1 hypothetical protein HBI76_162950 [Parastagonospora nodorum]KAH5407931.1 hypothetical protein HBI46_182340 [Parastagonospora nodorum]KAH5555152.1 hypothetical protein HBI25_156290 [Parastagonospora nodorum]